MIDFIDSITVRHSEKNYFNDGFKELRHDVMYFITEEKVCAAIDKMVRRGRKSFSPVDCMFVTYTDGSGWRLYPKHGEGLILRHYLTSATDSWDTEESVSAGYAKKAILGY